MLAVIACLAGIALILLIAEILWKKKILRGEYQRKFVHITAGTFIAFWPWILTFKQIQLLSLAMLVVVMFVQKKKILHFTSEPARLSYGFVFFALSVFVVATLADSKLIFALSILMMALADGFAAIAGKAYGDKWKYLIFTHNKTLIGSMVFWITSLLILGVGLLFTPQLANYHYTQLLIFLPPILTIVENIPGLGSDNFFVPLVTVLALNWANSH